MIELVTRYTILPDCWKQLTGTGLLSGFTAVVERADFSEDIKARQAVTQ